jgi:hypothetical protein
MPTRFVGIVETALVVAVTSCQFPSMHAPSCDDDIELCPKSSTVANSVTCDCRCTVGASEDTGKSYVGQIAVCLPPELSSTTASDEQRVAIQALEPRDFDQRVFRYCSREVTRFLRTTVKMHSLLRLASCVQPVMCECSTAGTTRESSVCRSPCREKACDDENCPSVLMTDATLSTRSCNCSRASVCGQVAPEEDRPGLCRDSLALTRTSDAGPSAER